MQRNLKYFLALTLTVAAGVSAAVPATAAAAPCSNEALRQGQKWTYLPDCRGFELVSPIAKDDNEVSSPGFLPLPYQVPFSVKANGPGATYSLAGASAESESAALFTTGVAFGAEPATPWGSLDLAPTSAIEPLGAAGGNRSNGAYEKFSPSLGCGVFASNVAQTEHLGEGPALLPEGENVGEHAPNLYVWNRAGNRRELATTLRPRNLELATENGENQFIAEGASDDCGRIAFSADNHRGLELPLAKGSSNYAPLTSIYEWNRAGESKLASLVPTEKGEEVPAQRVNLSLNGTSSTGGGSNYNMISGDGRQLFFVAAQEPTAGATLTKSEPLQIFDRFEGKETVEISASQTGVASTGATFEAASADGTHVFFLANHGLTPGGDAAPTNGCNVGTSRGCDLYEFAMPNGNPHEGTLRDLTQESEGATGANVRGVLGIAPSGEYVYFSTSGQLVPGEGKTQAENELACKTVNVYGYHAGSGQMHFIANISLIEAGGSASEVPGTCPNTKPVEFKLDALAPAGGVGMKFDVARVSPDGRYLLFATAEPQTPEGYGEPFNNKDALSGQPDEMLYEYHFSEGTPKLRCASCSPAGLQPKIQFGQFSAEGIFNVVRGGVLVNNIVNDGRVFFTNDTPLVEGATYGRHAYEYQPPGYIGSNGEPCAAKGCFSMLQPKSNNVFPTFLEGVSENGEDVYITTVEPLVSQDPDGLRDMYDVRVGGGQQPEAAKEKCNLNEDKCQGEGTKGIGSGEVSEGGESTPITTTTEPAGEKIGHVVVLHRSVSKHYLTIKLRVPADGTIQISGKGLVPAGGNVGAGIRTFRVNYGGHTLSLLRHHKHPRISIRVAFSPADPEQNDSSAAWSFRA